MTMTTRTVKILMILLLVFTMMVPAVARSEAPCRFGRFIEIRHEEYMGPAGQWMTEYVMYDRTTLLVYIYTTDGKSMLSITPYLMRDYFGQITCGLYNKETGGVDPAEMSDLIDEDEWEIGVKK